MNTKNKFSEYTVKSVDEVFADLESFPQGLSEKEAELRLNKYGLNEIKSKGTTLLEIFTRQLKSPFFYLLFIAALLAFLIGEKVDGFVVLAFVFINVALGFLQEFRAERAVSLLKKYIPSKTTVKREGIEKTISKNLIVPGDIVIVEAGDIPPADLRLVEEERFLVDESVLTGESAPVPKNPKPISEDIKEIFGANNMLFGGTLIISGRAMGIVVSSGKNTVLGQISKLVSETKRESAYEKTLLYFSKLILKIVVSTIALIFLANLIIHKGENLFDFSLFCIALIVSILPEALPAVVTFALSQSAMRMAKEKVVVRRLSAIEDLGNIEILCADKTGTLTQNKISLEDVFSHDKEKCFLYGLLTSAYVAEKIESSINPFDYAIFQTAPEAIRANLKNFKSIAENPFDASRMRNCVLAQDEQENKILVFKGSPESILELCSSFGRGKTKDLLKEEIKRKGQEGRRILAVAYKKFRKKSFSEKDEKGLSFLGYFTFLDPLKENAKEAIDLAKKMGVKIKIITGDSKEVAGYVSKEMELIDDSSRVVLGKDIEILKEGDFDKACEEYTVFARIPPELKYKIVKSLQKKYEVGFVGEGINDAPALKLANVGIVVREASDVSREVADIVLLEKDLTALVNGIKNGRNIFSNINKYIKCALASNFGNFYSIAVISLFIPFLPLLPVQILLGNLLSDFPLISIATDSIDVEELKRPKLYQLRQMAPLIVFLAMVSTIFDFIFFAIFYSSQPAIIQTLWYIESILTEILLIFLIRTKHFFLNARRPSWPLILFTIFDAILIVWLPFSQIGQELFHFTTPPWPLLFIVFSLVLSYFIVSEIVKLIYFRFWRIKQNY